MTEALQIVSNCFGDRLPGMDTDFNAEGVDSYDLLTLRANFDEEGFVVNESQWLKAKTLNELLKSVEKKSASNSAASASADPIFKRQYSLNMPQMAQGGLSESWLMKEAGDMHWRAIAKGLNTPSDNITDTRDERLYATFVRIRWQSSAALSDFVENEHIDIDLNLSRWGKGFYSGQFNLNSEDKNVGVEMLTSFVSREGGNEGLQKGEPTQAPDAWVNSLKDRPTFMDECRDMRKDEPKTHTTLGYDFPLNTDKEIFTWERKLNPYTDLNGVNLLYFAAYPPILDTGEWNYAQGGDLGLDTSLVGRDIFYFANCSPGDTMIYRLRYFEVQDGHIYSFADLYRKSDQTRMCRVFNKRKILNSEKTWQ